MGIVDRISLFEKKTIGSEVGKMVKKETSQLTMEEVLFGRGYKTRVLDYIRERR